MASTNERLQEYTLAHVQITLTLASGVVAAVGYDAVQPSVDFGSTSKWLFYASLVCFALSGLCGGTFSTKLVTLSDQASWYELRIPLLHLWGKPIANLKGGHWRTGQHRFLWAGIIAAALAGLTIEQAETAASGAVLPEVATIGTAYP